MRKSFDFRWVSTFKTFTSIHEPRGGMKIKKTLPYPYPLRLAIPIAIGTIHFQDFFLSVVLIWLCRLCFRMDSLKWIGLRRPTATSRSSLQLWCSSSRWFSSGGLSSSSDEAEIQGTTFEKWLSTVNNVNNLIDEQLVPKSVSVITTIKK